MREDWIQPILDDAKAQGLQRAARVYPEAGGLIRIDGKEVLNFSSNDYLDLARHPHVMDRAREALDLYGVGSTASRPCRSTKNSKCGSPGKRDTSRPSCLDRATWPTPAPFPHSPAAAT